MTWKVEYGSGSYTIRQNQNIVIGSGDSCEIRIAEKTVSRRHLLVRLGERGLSVRDLRSRNGSFVENMRLDPGEERTFIDKTRVRLANCFEIKLEPYSESISPACVEDIPMSTHPAVNEETRECCLLAYRMARDKMLEEVEPDFERSLREVVADNDVFRSIAKTILSEYIEFSFISKHMDDDEVSEILINGHSEIWIERFGDLELASESFQTKEGLDRFVEVTLASIHKKIDILNPFACGRMRDGSRVTVMAGSIVHQGLHVSIRKFNGKIRSLSSLEKLGSISEDCGRLLKSLVQDRKNIIVSGGTGSGKTTLLTSLLNEVPASQRVIAIEDTSEIFVDRKNFLRCESREENAEGRGAVSIRALIRQSLRMRPDRIILGECRGEETIDLLQALNTGHSGSMSTIHANSTRDAISRLELLCLLAKERMDPAVARRFIANSVDYILQMSRINGDRRLTRVSRVAGMESDQVLLETIYAIDDTEMA